MTTTPLAAAPPFPLPGPIESPKAAALVRPPRDEEENTNTKYSIDGSFYNSSLPSSSSSVDDDYGSMEDSPLPIVEKTASQSYPEGGRQAWLVVLGAFCAMLCGFGFMNTIGIFQSYLMEHQLSGYNESTVGWIFSVYVYLAFFLSLQIGPIFDLRGPRMLLILGSVFMLAAVFLLGACTKYWHFMIVIGFLAGTGSSLLFTPSVSAIGHYFNARRGMATGFAATGGAIGGTVFPLMLQALFPRVGWAWSTRILGFIMVGLCLVATSLVRARLPPEKPKSFAQYLPDLRILAQPSFAMTTAGVFCMEWGLFIPLTYVTSYIIKSGLGTASLGYTVVAILNAGSVIGRAAPGLIADKVGRYNSMIVLLFFCFLTTAALWLPCVLLGITTDRVTSSMKPLIIVYAFLFGAASGANISLTPVCIGQLCRTREYGRYYATCYTLVSFGALTGIPLAGALIEAANGEYYGVIIFTAGCYLLSFIMFIAARAKHVGWRVKEGGKWIKF